MNTPIRLPALAVLLVAGLLLAGCAAPEESDNPGVGNETMDNETLDNETGANDTFPGLDGNQSGAVPPTYPGP